MASERIGIWVLAWRSAYGPAYWTGSGWVLNPRAARKWKTREGASRALTAMRDSMPRGAEVRQIAKPGQEVRRGA